MRRRNDRAPAKEASQCILYELLACGIKGRGRLVQQDDRRIAKKRPCDRQTLALPAREFKPPFADDGLESFRKPPDELGAVRRFGGGIDLGVGAGRSAAGQLVASTSRTHRHVRGGRRGMERRKALSSRPATTPCSDRPPPPQQNRPRQTPGRGEEQATITRPGGAATPCEPA